ncbi:MAG: hypothetical protein DWQ01_00515 [Planctomycetota bacterium]|nr:MAG: hypothetical protein DWQ01_00515 [Planctomycetota bacterium]
MKWHPVSLLGVILLSCGSPLEKGLSWDQLAYAENQAEKELPPTEPVAPQEDTRFRELVWKSATDANTASAYLKVMGRLEEMGFEYHQLAIEKLDEIQFAEASSVDTEESYREYLWPQKGLHSPMAVDRRRIAWGKVLVELASRADEPHGYGAFLRWIHQPKSRGLGDAYYRREFDEAEGFKILLESQLGTGLPPEFHRLVQQLQEKGPKSKAAAEELAAMDSKVLPIVPFLITGGYEEIARKVMLDRYVGQVGPSAPLLKRIAELYDDSAVTRAQAARRRWDAKALPFLGELLGDWTPLQWVENNFQALKNRGRPTSPSEEAGVGLSRSGPEGVELLIKGVIEESHSIDALCRGLSEIKNEDYIQRQSRMLLDEMERVRPRAKVRIARALGALGSPEAVDPLVKAMKRAEEWIRSRGPYAHEVDDQDYFSDTIAWAPSESSLERASILALGEIGGQKAARELCRRLDRCVAETVPRKDNQLIWWSLMDAMKSLNDPSVIPALRHAYDALENSSLPWVGKSLGSFRGDVLEVIEMLEK